MVSSPKPQLTAEEVVDEEDVDIGDIPTPRIHDDFWDEEHPNSPLHTPLTQVPQSLCRTKEIHAGSDERRSSLRILKIAFLP